MTTIDVFDIQGKKVSNVELSDAIFNVPINKGVLHQVVTAQLAKKRAGTATVKNRSDVSGSRRKLFRQKGTGRARRGDIKSPLLRGGGVVFGPHPRSYEKKIPKKVRKLALKMALTSKARESELIVLNEFEMQAVKTKQFLDAARNINVSNALIVTPENNSKLELSSRNVPGVKVLRYEGLNVYDILKYEKLVLIEGAIKGIEGRLLP
jgi:large subunit ribosomal protein L4